MRNDTFGVRLQLEDVARFVPMGMLFLRNGRNNRQRSDLRFRFGRGYFLYLRARRRVARWPLPAESAPAREHITHRRSKRSIQQTVVLRTYASNRVCMRYTLLLSRSPPLHLLHSNCSHRVILLLVPK